MLEFKMKQSKYENIKYGDMIWIMGSHTQKYRFKANNEIWKINNEDITQEFITEYGRY